MCSIVTAVTYCVGVPGPAATPSVVMAIVVVGVHEGRRVCYTCIQNIQYTLYNVCILDYMSIHVDAKNYRSKPGIAWSFDQSGRGVDEGVSGYH